jgi:hypothetical protein
MIRLTGSSRRRPGGKKSRQIFRELNLDFELKIKLAYKAIKQLT